MPSFCFNVATTGLNRRGVADGAALKLWTHGASKTFKARQPVDRSLQRMPVGERGAIKGRKRRIGCPEHEADPVFPEACNPGRLQTGKNNGMRHV